MDESVSRLDTTFVATASIAVDRLRRSEVPPRRSHPSSLLKMSGPLATYSMVAVVPGSWLRSSACI